MIHLDALDDTTSYLEENKTYPTGIALVRDARDAKPLNRRYSPDNPIILANNMLLRALNTMRGIDHSLRANHFYDQADYLNKSLSKLVKNIIDFQIAYYKKPHNDSTNLKKWHTYFNHELIEILHSTFLDEGLRENDYEKLLSHYRYLASVLDPAKSMVTILHDKKNDIIHRISTSYYTKNTRPNNRIKEDAASQNR